MNNSKILDIAIIGTVLFTFVFKSTASFADDTAVPNLEKSDCPTGTTFYNPEKAQDLIFRLETGTIKTCVAPSESYILVVDKKSVAPQGLYLFYDEKGLLYSGSFTKGYVHGEVKKRSADGKMEVASYFWHGKDVWKNVYDEKKSEEDCNANNGDACFQFSEILKTKNPKKAKEFALRSCELKSQLGCDAKEKLEAKAGEKAKKKALEKQAAENAEKILNSQPCKKSYSFMHYCRNLGMLRAAQFQVDREKALAKRSGYPNASEMRRWTNAVMQMESAVAKAKTYYQKFNGSAPALSSCKVIKDDGNNFLPDQKTQKMIDDSNQKNCGTTQPLMDF